MKVLVICALAQTARELAAALKQQSGLGAAVFHEDLTIIERDRAAAWFADEDAQCQALICSEIGSEGRNFQFAHHLVLFDLPLDPDLLEQRIGRLDRIGQSRNISIHVPILQGCAGAVQFRWLHEGLDAFENPCPAGPRLYEEFRSELESALLHPGADMTGLLQRCQQRRAELERAMQQGRDRLLEYNSCQPRIAAELCRQAQAEEAESDLAAYLEQVFDSFGVAVEDHSNGLAILRPGPHMLTSFPGIDEDGVTVTCDRNLALSHEDVLFLSRDHPLVRTAMDMVTSTEMGNTALITLETDHVEAGTVLLECIFVLEIASAGELQGDRYLPPTTVRTLVDEKLRDYSAAPVFGPALPQGMDIDRDTAASIIRARKAELKAMLDHSEASAGQAAAKLLTGARATAAQMLTTESERLRSLAEVNPAIRAEEIAYFETRLQQLDGVFGHTVIRLDALRVIVST